VDGALDPAEGTAGVAGTMNAEVDAPLKPTELTTSATVSRHAASLSPKSAELASRRPLLPRAVSGGSTHPAELGCVALAME